MIPFLLSAALLVVATLLILLRPWQIWLRSRLADSSSTAEPANSPQINANIYRDQLQELDRDLATGTLLAADHEQARTELQRRLLDDITLPDTPQPLTSTGMRRTAWLLALGLPLAAAGLYAVLGAPAALNPQASQGVTPSDVEKMLAGLAERMQKNPGDTKGWAVLARSYRVMGRLALAQAAFERVGPELERDPNLLAEYADVLASQAAGNLEGKPMQMVERALQIEPNNTMALSLAATAAYNRQDFAQAISRWEHLQKLVPADSEDAKWLANAIEKVRAQTSADSAPRVTASPQTAIIGRVSLSPTLASKVQATDTVFIFARAVQGPRMPLAVQKAHVSDLPLDFKLDDSSAMSPQLKLSGFEEVRVEARISRNGSATPASGDLMSLGEVVKPGASKVMVEIDQVKP